MFCSKQCDDVNEGDLEKNPSVCHEIEALPLWVGVLFRQQEGIQNKSLRATLRMLCGRSPGALNKYSDILWLVDVTFGFLSFVSMFSFRKLVLCVYSLFLRKMKGGGIWGDDSDISVNLQIWNPNVCVKKHASHEAFSLIIFPKADNEDVITYCWSTSIMSIVINKALLIPSRGSGVKGPFQSLIWSPWVLVIHGIVWIGCHKVPAQASPASGPLALCAVCLLPPHFSHLYCHAGSPHAQGHPLLSWYSSCP